MNRATPIRRRTRVRSSIDLIQLQYVVAAADRGSLRQVTELHRVRHSVVSRSIRQMEHSIGAILFERSGNGVRPTAIGRNVLRMARMILEQVDALVAVAKSNNRGDMGRLSVGFCTSISAGNLRATFVDFITRHPQIELTTVERSRIRLSTQLRSGAVDILILAGDIPALGDENLPLWSERIFVAIPEEHPLGARDVLFWTDLRGETLLLSSYDPGPELEALLVSKLASSSDRRVTPKERSYRRQTPHGDNTSICVVVFNCSGANGGTDGSRFQIEECTPS